MVFSLWLWQTTKSTMTKNTCEMLAILIAMRIWRCDARHIAWWSASVASCKATRCRYWASACTVLPRQPPWSTILKKKNSNKTQLLPSFHMVDWQKKAKQFRDPPGTLYSHPWHDVLWPLPLRHYSSWRHYLHFELSNVENGWKFEKLWSSNEAQENLWAIYGPIVVKLVILHYLHSACYCGGSGNHFLV